MKEREYILGDFCSYPSLDPSPDSAGYDPNKIIRTEYYEPIYTKMGQCNVFDVSW